MFTEIKAYYKDHSRIIRQCIALGLIVLVAVASLIFLSYLYSDVQEITTNPKPRTFEVPININLNGAKGFVDSQISIGLTFTYPNGILFVGDKVEINGHAYLGFDAINISKVAISFQNCLEYPVFEIFKLVEGLPKQGVLIFSNEMTVLDYNRLTGEAVSVWYGDVNVTWSVEGEYKPLIGIFYEDGRSSTYTVDDVVIHVYPKDNLLQMQTNKVTIILAVVAFVISIIGCFSIVYAVYPKKQDSNFHELCKQMKELTDSMKQTKKE